jgi:hypothetical protein
MDVLYQYHNSNRLDSKEAQIFVHHKLKALDSRKPRYIEKLLASLDRLIPVAEKQNVLLGLENRYHYHELPGFDDFSVLKSCLKKTTIKVIELKPGISNTEVLKGIQYVAEVLLS